MRPDRLREAHLHLAWHARMRKLARGSLADCQSQSDAIEMVREACAATSKSQSDIVLLPDARPEGWIEGTFPSLDQLDEASGGRPVVLRTFDYHSMMVNSNVLDLAGITGETPDPKAGRVVRNSRGELTGVLLESACAPVNTLFDIDRIDVAELHELFAAEPFVEYHEMLAQPDLGPALRRVEQHAHREGRFEQMPRFELFADVSKLSQSIADAPSWECDWLRLAGGKIFVDGTLNSRTAWMLEPYADGPAEHPAGMPMMMPREIDQAIRICAAHGIQLACHAIGDGAVRAVLDAVDRTRPPRWTVRIEHAEIIDEADVARFAELGVIASVQPCHLLADIEALERALPARLERVLPLRELIDSGLEPGRSLVFGSDAPILPTHPEPSIRAATQRSRSDSTAIAPSQAISQAEAWACFDADIEMNRPTRQ